MAEHRSGVAQAEILVAMPVHVPQLRPLRTIGKQREGRAPVEHPVERHTLVPMPGGVAGQRGGRGIGLDKTRAFSLKHQSDGSPRDHNLSIMASHSIPPTNSGWRRSENGKTTFRQT